MHQVLGQILSKLWFLWQPKSPIFLSIFQVTDIRSTHKSYSAVFVIPDPEYINLKQELESALRDAGPLPKETERGHDRFIIRGRRVLMKQELKSI